MKERGLAGVCSAQHVRGRAWPIRHINFQVGTQSVTMAGGKSDDQSVEDYVLFSHNNAMRRVPSHPIGTGLLL
jgi:hypothetical protein